MTKHAQEEEAGGGKRLDASDWNIIREELQKHTFAPVAAPGFKKWGGKKGATIDYGGANMCA